MQHKFLQHVLGQPIGRGAIGVLLWMSPTAYAADLSPAIQPLTIETAARSAVDQAAYRRWKISLAPVIASQTLDVASSFGRRELNPLLAGPDGRFGARGAGIKLGAVAGILGVEYLIVRHHPGAARVLSHINFSVSIATSGFAVHNFATR
jgi:hypothetical protein